MSDPTENTSKSSREQLEARVVAMLLGEASPFEEEQLREYLKGDTTLAKFCTEIGQTLPLLNEALDVRQAPKAKSPKPRLARKRRGKLKLLFRSDTGLAKRRIVRLDFRKVLAIAAAVCVVLFIAAGLFLPNLIKAGSNGGRNSANQTKGIADTEATQLAESKPNFKQNTFTATAGFSMVETGEDRPDSTLLGEPFGRSLQIGGEAGQLALPTGTVSTHGAVVTAIPGFANGEATAESLLNRSDYELSNSGGPGAQLGRRKFAELPMPESEDRAETPNRAAYQEMAAGLVANQQGQARDLGETKEMEGFGVNESLAMAQSAPPAEEPVPIFEDGYARTARGSAPKTTDGINLYWYREKPAAESGGQSAMAPKSMPYGMGESDFVQLPSVGAGERYFKSHGIDSIYSTVTAGEPTAKEFFKRRSLNGPTILPVPQAAGNVADGNGRAFGWGYDIADKNADQSSLNKSVNRDLGVHNKRNWAGSMADDLANEQLGERAETLKKDSLGGGMGGMGMGGGGFAGGGGHFVGGFAMGNSPGMGMPESALPSSNSRFAMAALPQPSGSSQPVSGGVAGSFSLYGDTDGQLESDGKPTAFGRARSLEQGQLGLGTADFRTVEDRGDLQLSEDESRTRRQTVDATSGKKGYSAYDSSGQDVSVPSIDRLAEITSGDQSGDSDFYFDAQMSPAKGGKPGYAGQREQAKEGRKAKETLLSDVPMLGGMFKNGVKAGTAGRELARIPQLRSVDEKTRTQRSGSSRSSGRGRTLGLDRAAKDLAKLSVVESESLVEAVDEAQVISSPGQRQLLEGKLLGANHKRIDSRKSQSSGMEKKSLRGNGKQMAANKELPAPKAKPQSAERLSRLSLAKRDENRLKQTLQEVLEEEAPSAKPPTPSVVYTPRPETVTAENSFSTFSLNVSDVTFKTTLASLQSNKLPEPGDVRSEEFLNALEYRDPMPGAGDPLAFHWERARSPFTYDRDIIRFSVRTAAQGRQPGRAINLVCLLDNSGSMEREDRVSIVQQALDVLARKLTPNDRVSLVTFSRTPKLRIDGMRGGNREAFLKASTGWIPQGGTDIGSGLNLAYATAKKHFIPGGNSRVILLTDGAANMGNVDPYQLRKTVESHRKQGIALDCFGVGWGGYNDNLLEVLARNGDGRYGFLNQPVQAVAEFEQKLLGAFQVAASDVKVQVEWNADRVRVFRQVGYLRHQLKKEDFRNNKIDAAEISAAESGNALYVVQVDPGGQGPLGVVRVRYKVPFTNEYTELEWSLAYESAAAPLEQASPALRLGSVAATFAEWLAGNPYAQGVQLADLQGLMFGIPSIYGTAPRPRQLEWMIGKARLLTGN